jgi:hypothetical protein
LRHPSIRKLSCTKPARIRPLPQNVSCWPGDAQAIPRSFRGLVGCLSSVSQPEACRGRIPGQSGSGLLWFFEKNEIAILALPNRYSLKSLIAVFIQRSFRALNPGTIIGINPEVNYAIFPVHLSRSFRPPLLVGFPEGYRVFYAPQPIHDTSGHRWASAQRPVNLDEIVREIIESSRSRVILQLAAEPFDKRV